MRSVKIASAAIALVVFAFTMGAHADGLQPPTLPSGCANLQVLDGSMVKFHAYATGSQIYRWNGISWVFLGPLATLSADPGYHGQVGIHHALAADVNGLNGVPTRPVWESKSGSNVVGKREAACTPDPAAIPWLRLSEVSTQGPGVFDGVTNIQRVNTVGGLAPSTPGATDEVRYVPYTAEYFFYSVND